MAEVATFQSISAALKKGNPAPVYMLHGEEGYYIDALSHQIEGLVDEADRDFNLTVLYAPQTEPSAVVEACRRYPMMADRQVVIVREAQNGMPPRFGAAAWLKGLAQYVAEPNPATVLCICFRGAEAKSAEFFRSLPKGGGVNFISKKLNDRTIGPAVTEFIKSRGLSIESKALAMLSATTSAPTSRASITKWVNSQSRWAPAPWSPLKLSSEISAYQKITMLLSLFRPWRSTMSPKPSP